MTVKFLPAFFCLLLTWFVPPLSLADEDKSAPKDEIATDSTTGIAQIDTAISPPSPPPAPPATPPIIDQPASPSYGPSIDSEATNPASESTKEPQAITTDDDERRSSDSTAEDEAGNTAYKTIEKAEDEDDQHWTNTHPEKVTADWLQLTSGEWLRGRITVMQKDSLEFDSDELDELVIDWKKVRYLKSYEPYSLRFDGRVLAVGVIEVTQDKILVTTDYDDQVFDRSALQTIASGQESEISYWRSKVTFSLNLRKGNTDQTDFTSKINAKRRTTDSRLVLDYLGNFTEIEKKETINNHRLNATYDLFITRYLFWSPVFGEYYRDTFQNIDQKINLGTAIGYTLIDTSKTEWNISAGPSYQQTKFVSVQGNPDRTDSTLTFTLSTYFDIEVNSKVDFEGSYSATLGDKETGNYTHHSILTIETELTDKLDVDISTVWDRVRSPVTDKDGITPDKDDFRIMVGLGYDL